MNPGHLTRDTCRIMASEAQVLGAKWRFTPVLDINAARRRAIDAGVLTVISAPFALPAFARERDPGGQAGRHSARPRSFMR